MKKRCLKKSMYMLLFISLSCYGLSLSIYLIIYFKEFVQNNTINNNKNKLEYIGKTFIVTNIIIIIFIFISTTFFACCFNSFLTQGYLLFFIISLIVMLIFELPSSFILLENILYNKSQLVLKILLNFILNIIEIICGFVSIIISISLRNLLIEEIEQSPLNFVDLNMTENIYNNIMKKSGNYKRRLNDHLIND